LDVIWITHRAVIHVNATRTCLPDTLCRPDNWMQYNRMAGVYDVDRETQDLAPLWAVPTCHHHVHTISSGRLCHGLLATFERHLPCNPQPRSCSGTTSVRRV